MPDKIISIKGISKSFANRQILRNVNIDVEQGEFLVILGVSGCGKTTLLRLISGLEAASSGSISFAEGSRMSLNYIFQHLALMPWRNVYKNISVGLEFMREAKAGIRDAVEECIDLVGLKGYERFMPNQLSGGLKQRVAFARAIACRSKVILMDEPFNSLDFYARKEMQEIALKLSKKLGITVIFVTHDIDEALSMADRLIILSPAPSCVVADMNTISGDHFGREMTKKKIFELLKK